MTSFILLAEGPVSPLDALRGIKYMKCYNRYSATTCYLLPSTDCSFGDDAVKKLSPDWRER